MEKVASLPHSTGNKWVSFMCSKPNNPVMGQEARMRQPHWQKGKKRLVTSGPMDKSDSTVRGGNNPTDSYLV